MINGKAGDFHILTGMPSPTEMRKTIALLKKYQILEPLDVMEELDEKFEDGHLSVYQYRSCGVMM